MKEPKEIIIETVAQIKAGSKALDDIEHVLQRDEYQGSEVCRYCGSTEDICPACGVCPEDHIMMLGDAFVGKDPENFREFGKNILIVAASDTEFHGPPVSVALVYISEPEVMLEALEVEYERRKGEVSPLDMDVWGDIFNDE